MEREGPFPSLNSKDSSPPPPLSWSHILFRMCVYMQAGKQGRTYENICQETKVGQKRGSQIVLRLNICKLIRRPSVRHCLFMQFPAPLGSQPAMKWMLVCLPARPPAQRFISYETEQKSLNSSGH